MHAIRPIFDRLREFLVAFIDFSLFWMICRPELPPVLTLITTRLDPKWIPIMPDLSLDYRSRKGRRVRQLAAAYKQALGGVLSPVQEAGVIRAAMLTAVAEDLQARRLAGEPIAIDDLVRADSTARRAVRDLNIKPGAGATRETIRERLIREAQERANAHNVT